MPLEDLILTNIRCPSCTTSLAPRQSQLVLDHGLLTFRCYNCNTLIWLREEQGPDGSPNMVLAGPQHALDSNINPSHYKSHPSGIECITIAEHYNFCIGNAIKYLWRAGHKSATPATTDLEKAIWYIQREVTRLTRGKS